MFTDVLASLTWPSVCLADEMKKHVPHFLVHTVELWQFITDVYTFLVRSACNGHRYASVRRVINILNLPLLYYVFELFPGNIHQRNWNLLKCAKWESFPSLIMWECFSLSSTLNNLENFRRVSAFAAWAFIWLSHRPKFLFALEQQSFKITHCTKIVSHRCSLLPMTFTQPFNGIQGPLKCSFLLAAWGFRQDKSKTTSQEKMWYQLLGCLQLGRDAVGCNVHIQ